MNEFLVLVNSWMVSGLMLGALGCFVWGIVSVLFSPCHLASIPLLVSYVAGQKGPVTGKSGAGYALCFSLGLFITIAAIGIICSFLNRMLGDVGNLLPAAAGILLLWISMDFLGIVSLPGGGGHLSKLRLKGMGGSLVLGLGYGLLSGSCTFGFIAPILAVITVQEEILTGILFIVLFGLGHCLPILLAGSSGGAVRRVLENTTYQKSSVLFRKLSGVVIGGLGVYFLTSSLRAAAL